MPPRDQDIQDKLKSRGRLPSHIAIIMDGNGRWAKKRGLPRAEGHRAGIKSVRDTVEACGEMGIQILTLYTFSTENWNRPKDEVSALMKLLLRTLQMEIRELLENNVRLQAIGDLPSLPDMIRNQLVRGIEDTQGNTGLILNLAINYGGREEILSAVRWIAEKVLAGEIPPDRIDALMFQKHLYTAGMPDPDLLIRTSGEMRISNFLLWQLAYTEIVITDVLWPDFRRDSLYRAIEDYQKRERRFGKISEQIS
jgi:undecaprenyl diphosphate synthase